MRAEIQSPGRNAERWRGGPLAEAQSGTLGVGAVGLVQVGKAGLLTPWI